MKTYTYLILDFLIFFFPFVISFEGKILNFKKYFPQVFLVISVLTLGFSWLSHFFIVRGVYSLNPLYNTGKGLFSIPLDEMFFYFSWGYFCLFSYQIFKKFGAKYLKQSFRVSSFFMGLLLLGFAIWQRGNSFPFILAMATGILCVMHAFIFKSRFIGIMLISSFFQLLLFLAIRLFFVFLPMYIYQTPMVSPIKVKGILLEEIINSLLISILSITLYEFVKQRMNKSKKYAS